MENKIKWPDIIEVEKHRLVLVNIKDDYAVYYLDSGEEEQLVVRPKFARVTNGNSETNFIYKVDIFGRNFKGEFCGSSMDETYEELFTAILIAQQKM